MVYFILKWEKTNGNVDGLAFLDKVDAFLKILATAGRELPQFIAQQFKESRFRRLL